MLTAIKDNWESITHLVDEFGLELHHIKVWDNTTLPCTSAQLNLLPDTGCELGFFKQQQFSRHLSDLLGCSVNIYSQASFTENFPQFLHLIPDFKSLLQYYHQAQENKNQSSNDYRCNM